MSTSAYLERKYPRFVDKTVPGIWIVYEAFPEYDVHNPPSDETIRRTLKPLFGSNPEFIDWEDFVIAVELLIDELNG